MKVVITSTGNNLDSEMDPRFGRAKYFIIYNTETGSTEVIDNAQNVAAAHGAGIQAAQTVIDTGAKVLITGNVGPKAYDVLGKSSIEIVTGRSGSCREILANYK